MNRARHREQRRAARELEAMRERIAFADDNFYTGLVVGLILGIVACVIF